MDAIIEINRAAAIFAWIDVELERALARRRLTIESERSRTLEYLILTAEATIKQPG